MTILKNKSICKIDKHISDYLLKEMPLWAAVLILSQIIFIGDLWSIFVLLKYRFDVFEEHETWFFQVTCYSPFWTVEGHAGHTRKLTSNGNVYNALKLILVYLIKVNNQSLVLEILLIHLTINISRSFSGFFSIFCLWILHSGLQML